MPRLFNKALSRWEMVPNEAVELAVQSGEYDIPEGLQVAVETPSGGTAPASLEDVALTEGDLPLATEAAKGGEEEKAYLAREYGGTGDAFQAFGEGVLQGASLGGYGALQRLLEPEAAERSRARAGVQEGPRFAGELVGAVAPAVLSGGAGAVGGAAALTPAGAAARLGTSIAARGGGGVGRAALGLGVEGAIGGAGAGVGQVSMSDDPLTLERAISTISSNALFGAGIGGAAGVLGKVAEKGLARARRAVDESVAEAQATERSIAEVGVMDRTELRAARDAEFVRVEAEELAPARAQLAQDISAHRDAARAQKPWIALEGLKKGEQGSRELRVIGSDYLSADKKLDRLLRDPKTMAEEPWQAKKALREEEAALLKLKAARPEIEARLGAASASAHGGGAGDRAFRMLPDDEIDDWSTQNMTPPGWSEDTASVFKRYQGTGARGSSHSLNPDLRAGRQLRPEDARLAAELDDVFSRPAFRTPEDLTVFRGVELGRMPTAAGELITEPAFLSTSLSREAAKRYQRASGNQTLRQGSRLTTEQYNAIDEAGVKPPRVTEDLSEEQVAALRAAGFEPPPKPEPGFLMEIDLPAGSRGVSMPGVAGDTANATEWGPALGLKRHEILLPRNSQMRVLSVDPEARVVRVRIEDAAAPAGEASAVVGSRRIPSWEKLTSEKRVTRTVPFEDIEPHLIAIDGTIGGRMENIREGVKKGVSIADMGRADKKPINLTVLPSGKLFVEDGRHRLRVMAEMAAEGKPVKARVRFAKGVAGVENGTVPMFPDALARRSITADARLQALGTVDGLLEQNAALQARIAQLTPQRLGGPPLASPKLQAIQEAGDRMDSATGRRGLMEDVTRAYAISAAVGAMPGGPLGAVAAVGARRGLRKIGDWVFGRMSKSAAAAEQRTARALSALVGAGEKVARTALPLASRVLSRVSFAGDEDRQPVREPKRQARPDTAVGAFLAREREIRDQTRLGPDGNYTITPAARERIAERLKGVGAVDPLAADAMETQAVRRIEYLAKRLPRRPDMGHMQVGPERWTPNTLEVRTFARIVSALEDPGGVEERMVTGLLTPDEADAYREVYPERWADFQQRIIDGVGQMKKPLSRAARLGLTIMTGVPWDPALSPPILKVLQAVHLQEEGSEGGEQAPRAQPQFGSVTRESPTKAQQRSEG